MMSVNLWAVLIAAVLGEILGMLWYSSKLFGTLWMKEIGWTPESINESKKKGMGKTYAFNALADLVMAYVLAHVVVAFGGSPFAGAIWMWLGFQVPILLGSVFWDNKSWKLFGINAGYRLAALLVFAAVYSMF